MDKQNIQEIKTKLEETKIQLEKELQSFANADENVKGDWDTRFPEFNNGGNLEEAADEVVEYEEKLQIEHNLELRLRDINLALEKIEKGNYGICEKCGKEIPIERLAIYPEARVCLSCKN